MIDIAVLEAMVAEGATAATIVRVVKMMVEREMIRRQQWADSQARVRAKRAISGEVVKYSTSQQTVNRHDTAYTKKEEDKKKSRKIYMPVDFAPNETDLAACRELNWPPSKIESELSRFRDHAAQNARQCADWHAAFRSWVRSPFQSPPKPNGGHNGHVKPPGLVAAADELLAEIRDARAAEARTIDVGGQASLFAIPHRLNGRS